MREACGGGSARLRLAHPLQLKIILSSSSGRASAANAKHNEVVPGKITFLASKNTHEHGFSSTTTEIDETILFYSNTPFHGILIIYALKTKIVDSTKYLAILSNKFLN